MRLFSRGQSPFRKLWKFQMLRLAWKRKPVLLISASLSLLVLFLFSIHFLGMLPFAGEGRPSFKRYISIGILKPAAAAADMAGSRPVSFLNDRAADITGAAAVNAPGFVVPGGLTGEGQIVAVADSGLDAGRLDDIHPDLQNEPGKMPKVVLLKSWAGRDVPDDPDGHGTHMAATIAGTGAASGGKFRGMAPGASIYFQAILNKDGEPEPPENLKDLFWPAYSAGARVHVDGWGGGPDAYLEPAAQVDDFVRSYPDFLVVFGAGNGGPSPRSITAEANSKNVLTVGASVLPRPAFAPGGVDAGAVAEFSSRGPAGDGRIKPELFAPASAVISARSRLVEGNLPGYPEYTRLQGTSMAAAVAGGTAALLREYFKKYMELPTPSAALVKAALINGARPLNGGPSKDGFGIIDLAGTVIALKDGTFKTADEWAGVPQGGEIYYTFYIEDPSAPFKATLAWTDPAAAPGGAQTLVNDLDLIVQTPDGRTYYGNHFLGKNAPDRINNVEQVYLPAPVPGKYTVRVAGAAVRRNVLGGSPVPVQDYALVWGQAPAVDMVESSNGQTVELAGGGTVNPAEVPVTNLVNGAVVPADAGRIFPGAAVYLTLPAGNGGHELPQEKEPAQGDGDSKERLPPAAAGRQRAYLAARLWRAAGVKALEMDGETVFMEINPAARLGGYALAADAGEILLNKSPVPPAGLPPGFEVSAVVNPLDQKIRRVQAGCIEREGVVLATGYEKGEKKLYLAGGGVYRVSPGAVYSYEDSYASVDAEDMPFGTGALEELEEVLPGMPVLLRLAPSTGEVQYLAVKRLVALGTVKEIDASGGAIKMEGGAAYRIFPGAPVKKDRKAAALDAVKPGDQVAAVLLPDTGEAIGLVAYSRVFCGKAIEFSKKGMTLYLLDNTGLYRSLYLPPDAVIYRWGVKTTAEALAAGSLVRVTTDPAAKEVWRLDVADTLVDKGVLAAYDAAAGTVTTGEGRQYRLSNLSRFYKNGCPVLPEHLRPGEQVEIEYAAAPPPAGSVLVSLSSTTAAGAPQLLFSAVPLPGEMVVTGRTGTNADILVWARGEIRQKAAVDEAGKFNFTFRPDDEGKEYGFTLVAVDRRTGGVAGREVTRVAAGVRGGRSVAVLDAVSKAVRRISEDVLPDRAGAGYLPEAPLARASAVEALAGLFNWPETSGWPLAFKDAEDIPRPSARP
ncbi:hypothetical serine protease [Pelotomaculum thermopropionicum SI]|uniref:Hypothetical serine protease n=1 Tax=Pelotomaculum thermopropionicum (strain DSM 13744 / JCM 10971 / SI) TaxID=370438 RepID=A5CYG2_PELTS|nr:hypothetical serine protease [Pelotomaculum thermopropionicum SI]